MGAALLRNRNTGLTLQSKSKIPTKSEQIKSNILTAIKQNKTANTVRTGHITVQVCSPSTWEANTEDFRFKASLGYTYSISKYKRWNKIRSHYNIYFLQLL